MGRKSGFNQRKGGISGYAFADTLVFSGTTFDKHSLNEQSSNLKIRHNIEVSKQGVDERYTDKTIEFIKSILSELLVKVITDNPPIEELSHFNATRIKDSTCFQVHECFVKYFPGSGGSASKAMVRIQFEYDVKTGEVLDLSLHAFNGRIKVIRSIHCIR